MTLHNILKIFYLLQKLSKDRTPSPAVTSAKPAVDAVDPLTSTTYRTRRTTAALAAAATQELQDKGVVPYFKLHLLAVRNFEITGKNVVLLNPFMT